MIDQTALLDRLLVRRVVALALALAVSLWSVSLWSVFRFGTNRRRSSPNRRSTAGYPRTVPELRQRLCMKPRSRTPSRLRLSRCPQKHMVDCWLRPPPPRSTAWPQSARGSQAVARPCLYQPSSSIELWVSAVRILQLDSYWLVVSPESPIWVGLQTVCRLQIPPR